MSAETTIFEKIHEHRNIWLELWWNMADGDVTKYNEIKRLDVFEFWSFFDRWKEKKDREASNLRQKTNKK